MNPRGYAVPVLELGDPIVVADGSGIKRRVRSIGGPPRNLVYIRAAFGERVELAVRRSDLTYDFVAGLWRAPETVQA